ncbi:mobilization protein [Thiocapsa imhoffii]|uniref:Mobilization protein n=1 Tax=Thiocapsa imhoffii TaxID=382777 RepID=A0A9X0WLE0_9GAMM|nr:mobilization protein [Thiocapsa imhoffii]MBK1646723.1 mobilization protein [Thiocapsa imhoffii]
MSKIHFIGGEKGGVGKSVLARLLAQYHIDSQRPFTVFDTDLSHGAMARFYGDYTQSIALDAFDDVDRLMEAALAEPRNVLVDLAAQTSGPLFRWIEQNDCLALAEEEGIGVVFWHVMDDGADGIALLERLIERSGGAASYVVVLNQGRGKDFSFFQDSTAREAAAAAGARVILFPELHQPTMRKVDHLGASFWAASQQQPGGLGLMERQRIKVWMRKGYEQFAGLGALLEVPAPNEDVREWLTGSQDESSPG